MSQFPLPAPICKFPGVGISIVHYICACCLCIDNLTSPDTQISDRISEPASSFFSIKRIHLQQAFYILSSFAEDFRGHPLKLLSLYPLSPISLGIISPPFSGALIQTDIHALKGLPRHLHEFAHFLELLMFSKI